MRLGIIDVGTNSCHLLIGSLGPKGTWRLRQQERCLTRLGDGGFVRGVLADVPMARTLRVLRRYTAITQRHHVDRIEAVATSAIRDARNGRSFLRRIRSELGWSVRIISGREEARLTYLGMRQAHRWQGQAVLVTIGGGSAQVMYGDRRALRYAASVPMGSARLAQQYLRHDPPRAGELAALRGHITRTWDRVARAVRRHRWRCALAGSAMVDQCLQAAYHRRHGRLPRGDAHVAISRRSVEELVAWLSTSTAPQRRALPGLDPRREDLLLPTGLVLLGWMDCCGLTALERAHGSLREGLVAHYRALACAPRRAAR